MSVRTFQGSRLRILQLIDSPGYLETINTVLRGYARITQLHVRRPLGGSMTAESEIPGFCREHCRDWFEIEKLDGWWLPAPPTGPYPKGATWDLISTCSMGDRPGLVLVEAKAHETELGLRGKELRADASEQSRINHQHIATCLSSVAERLRQSDLMVQIGVESHYQLANRIAWAWKLADCGVPVVLLYLGFLGDTYFTDYFKDSDHWQRTMGAYLHGILPEDLPGQTIDGRDGGAFTLLVESLAVTEPASA